MRSFYISIFVCFFVKSLFADTLITVSDSFFSLPDTVSNFTIDTSCNTFGLSIYYNDNQLYIINLSDGIYQIDEKDQLNGICFCTSCLKQLTQFNTTPNHQFKINSSTCENIHLIYNKAIKDDVIEKSIMHNENKYVKWGLKTRYSLGDTLQLNEIYFIGGSTNFDPKSRKELNELLTFAKTHPEFKLAILGHVNAPNKKNKTEYTDLSEKRAEAVVNFLIKFGIEKERLSYKGFGNTRMIYPNAQLDEEMNVNRRVEVVLE